MKTNWLNAIFIKCFFSYFQKIRYCEEILWNSSSQAIHQGQIANHFKGRVQCFSMQVVMDKCFLLNPENKFVADPSYFREKRIL